MHISRHPAFSIYAAVLNQPLYIKSIFEVVEADKSGLHKLFIGTLQSRCSKKKITCWHKPRWMFITLRISQQTGWKLNFPKGCGILEE
ncbi:hypothetical protein [Pseudomonas syringae]|uniref:hypothetical protein n=1 Tax=Pseudomonas syringae TaxID=317 RepID=UPI003B674EEE